MTSMAKRLGLTQPVVGYAVDRGKEFSKKKEVKLLNLFS
jgi:hypothetical protein